jgi:hypothetical protein
MMVQSGTTRFARAKADQCRRIADMETDRKIRRGLRSIARDLDEHAAALEQSTREQVG